MVEKKEVDINKNKKPKIFLIVGEFSRLSVRKHKDYFEKEQNIVFYNIADNRNNTEKYNKNREDIFEKTVFCNLNDTVSIAKTVKGFSERVVGVETLSDKNIKYLKNVIPFCPNALNPSESSLDWSTDKLMMRKLFSTKYKNISPKFLMLKSGTSAEKEAERIEKKLEYPIMIKPTNLASSKLVSKNYHREELVKSIKNVYKNISLVQRLRDKILDKQKMNLDVIAEEFMEGNMYSADGVVDKNGQVFCYPPCYVITGKNKGYDDFFAHTTRLPSRVTTKTFDEIKDVTQKAISSLNLTNSHFHIELIRTEEGFKVIEIAPRLGGFRRYMYRKVYGIDIFKNTLLNKMGKKVEIKNKVLETVAVMKIYAKEEGEIQKIYGKSKILKLESLDKLTQKYKSGTKVKFAKNGGEPVFIAYLSNKERGKLLGDVRKIEEKLKIKIKK